MKVTYALYATTYVTRNSRNPEWVMCMNFDDRTIAKRVAEDRRDLGDIKLIKHYYEKDQLIKTEEMEVFHH